MTRRRWLIWLLLLVECGLLAAGGCSCPDQRPAATVSEPLTVTATHPLPNAVAVPRSTKVRITFNREPDPATLAGAVTVRYPCSEAGVSQAMLPAVNGRYDPELKSLFIETAFIPGEEVEVEVGARVAAADGTALAAPCRLRFVVEADPAAAWTHELVFNRLGSQRSGKLAWRGRDLAPCAGVLTTPRGVYQCLEARDERSDTGWMRTDDPPAPLAELEPPLAPEEQANGQYPASLRGRRQGTPLHWVHLSLPDRAVWVHPKLLTDPLTAIP